MIVLPSQAEGREMRMSFKPSMKNDSSAFVAALNKEYPENSQKKTRESKKNMDSIRHVIREEDKKVDISLSTFDGPMFNHAVKRHFTKQPVNQSFDRSAGKKRVEMSKEERFERAGVSTLKEEAQFHKKIFKEQPDRKDKPHGKAVVKTTPDPKVAGKISSPSERESRRKLFSEKHNEEKKEYDFKDSRKRISSPKYKSVTSSFPIRGGGIIPEDTKTGIKVQSSTKPKDHGDVISYSFAPMKDSEPKLPHPNKEKVAYERLIKECGKQQAQENSAVYNYLRSRRSTSSLALTEHLYDVKGPVV